jgi:hypothetical protein
VSAQNARPRRTHGAAGRLVAFVVLPVLGAALGAACHRARTPRERFDAEVAPILEARCAASACHGVPPDAEASGDTIDWTHLELRLTSDGRLADLDAAYATVKARIVTGDRPELSSLLRKPLSRAEGGVPHLGGVAFPRRDDPAYRAVAAWIAEETGGGEGGAIESLPPNVRRFATDVLPRLAARQCMNAGCHDASAPFTAFEAPMMLDGERRFSIAAVRKDYAAARMHLFLGGDPILSRLVRKGLPLHQGGILHRGGNGIFFDESPTGDPRDDPTVRAILAWAEAERAAALPASGPTGLVYVRGPIFAASPFVHDGFNPGTDLWVSLPPLAPVNLTAVAHPAGPADVRDPAVRHDGLRIVFAMRTSEDDAHNLYEIGVDGSAPRQLTFDRAGLPGGGRVANVEPTYGPDGRVYFVSTRAGHLADGASTLDTEIWAVDPASGALERVTHDPSPEVTPSFIGTGKSYGTLSFTVLRGIFGVPKGVVFRAPLDHNKEYHGDPELHVHHGLTAGADVAYGARAMPDGRFVVTQLDFGNVWRGGRLAIFDRQLGPQLAMGAEAESSTPGYQRAFTVLDERATAGGASIGLYRHPTPLPDGRVLVSFAPSALDLGDPSAAPDLGLWALTIGEDPATGRPRVIAREPLIDEPGVAEYDAEPIATRPLEDDPAHARAWTPGAATGILAYRHVETLEAIMSHLAPTGSKPLRDDLVYARLVESIPVTPAELAEGPISIGVHGRERILAEVPLAGGSLQLEVPAGRPFRVQTLDAERMAIGTQHDRWIDVAPGQVFPGGVAPALYPALCSSCHGALSGRSADVGVAIPDAITTASMTLATHAGLDPRRPLPPIRVGDAPIELDFRRDVLPLLARSCASCHSGSAPAGGLDLEARSTERFDSAYEALLAPGEGSLGGRRFVDEAGASAFGSALIERVYGRELGAPRVLARPCFGEPPLSELERLTIARWIDLGAVYRGAAR